MILILKTAAACYTAGVALGAIAAWAAWATTSHEHRRHRSKL